jgi:hypothetical protein
MVKGARDDANTKEPSFYVRKIARDRKAPAHAGASAPLVRQTAASTLVAFSLAVAMMVVVMAAGVMIVVAIVEAAVLLVDAGAVEVEMSLRLVLVARQRIVAHDGLRFEVAAAMEAGRGIDAARSIVDRGLRIGTQWTRAAGRRGR